MADLTRPIQYMAFDLNTVVGPTGGGAIGAGISGCQVDSWDDSDMDVVQYTEKRSLEDGMDTGVVYLGARRLRLAGTLYGLTRALLFDAEVALRAAFSPVLAQASSPADHGYVPIYYEQPTNDTEDFSSGAISLYMNVMPKSLQIVQQRDVEGGNDANPLAVRWQATMVAADPRIYNQTPLDTSFSNSVSQTGTTAAATDRVTLAAHGRSAGDTISITSAGTSGLSAATGNLYYVLAAGLTTGVFAVGLTSGGAAVDLEDSAVLTWTVNSIASGTWENKGSYQTPANALIVVDAWGGTITGNMGGGQFTITIPSSVNNRTIRFKGFQKILTIEELGVETLAMGDITFQNATTWPLVVPGSSTYSWTFKGLRIQTGSHFWVNEAWV